MVCRQPPCTPCQWVDQLVSNGTGCGVDESWQEVVDDGPLVVPARQPAGALEDPFGTHALRPQIIDQLVVELDDRLVELDDDQVLVVTRVPDDGPAVAVTGHIQNTVDVRRQ